MESLNAVILERIRMGTNLVLTALILTIVSLVICSGYKEVASDPLDTNIIKCPSCKEMNQISGLDCVLSQTVFVKPSLIVVIHFLIV